MRPREPGDMGWVVQCHGFLYARSRGYGNLTLWSNDVLGAARSIHEEYGFELVKEEEYHSFGKDLVRQNWKLIL